VMVSVLRVVVEHPLPRRQHPPAVLRPHHALVLRLVPRGRHHVVLPEEVGGLVHQRGVPPAELEPRAGAAEAVQQVQVRLQVVVAREVQGLLEERRRLVVQLQQHAQVRVHAAEAQPVGRPQHELRERRLVEEHAGHLGHAVVHVHDAQRPHAQLLLEPPPEGDVPDARAGEGEHAHRRHPVARRHVRARLRDVEGAQHRQRAAQAVARDRHAHLLAPLVVQIHQLAHLGQHLLPRRVPAEAAAGALVRVQRHEPSLHLHVGVRAGDARLAQGDLVGRQIGQPLEAGDGAAPRHGDVPAAEPRRLLVGGNGHVPDERAGLGPHLGVGGGRLDAEVGELEVVAGGVEVAGDIVADAAEADVVEEGLRRVLAAAAVGGEAVVVEAVVGGLGELAIADELLEEHAVDGVQQTLPVVAAVDLPPPRGELPVVGRGLMRAEVHVLDRHRGGLLFGSRRRGDDKIAARTTTALKRVRQCHTAGEPAGPVVHGGDEAQAGRYGGRHQLLGAAVVVDAVRDHAARRCVFVLNASVF
jgi:hypothetical protein